MCSNKHIRDIVEEILNDIKDIRKGLNNLSDEVDSIKKDVIKIKKIKK